MVFPRRAPHTQIRVAHETARPCFGKRWGRPFSCLLAAAVFLFDFAMPLQTPFPGFQVRQASAQNRLVDKVARAEVPVFEDNLADAKNRVLRRAQSIALRSLVSDLIADEWVVLFDKELRRKVLPYRSRYVNSFRARRLEASVDRTRYLALLTVRLDRARLMDDLRDLGLPLLGDPVTPVVLLHERQDVALGDSNLQPAIVEKLTARLALLNFRLAGTARIRDDQVPLFTQPTTGTEERAAALRRFKSETALFVTFGPTTSGLKEGNGGRVRGWLYRRSTGMVMATFEHQARKVRLPAQTARDRKGLLAALVQPWLLRLQPGAINETQFTTGGSPRLKVRVFGFESVEDQERFEQAFLHRKSPFKGFGLYGYSPRAVTYEGRYRGDRLGLDRKLAGSNIGDFSVRQADWYNGVLEMNVERVKRLEHMEPGFFPPEKRPPEVASALESFFNNYTGLEVADPSFTEVEDNGWLARANRLPLDGTVYGYIDARSDKDFFVGEALPDQETFTIVWVRVGRSNLSPAIRLYDEEGVLVSTFQPTSWLRYRYKLPKGQHRFYLEISDRFGHLKVDTGGYRTFHYLFQVTQGGKKRG